MRTRCHAGRGRVSDGDGDHLEARKGEAFGKIPVGFVKDDEFLAARGEGDFFLGEAFDAVTDNVDTLTQRGWYHTL